MNFPGFEVEGLLGQGGSGAVFSARKLDTGVPAVIKVLRASSQASAQQRGRLRREARVLALLSHPSLVRVLATGVNEAGPWLAMERVEGTDLEHELSRAGPRPVEDVLEIGVQLAEGLAAAHAAGVVHRDLKPSNVVRRRDGRVVLIDFGLAKHEEVQESLTLSRTGHLLGTPGYWSPEQARGDSDLGPATDLYALAATLYALLTGHPPIVADSMLEFVVRTLETEPEPLGARRPDAPPALAELLARALAKDPAQRPPNARDFAAQLRACREGEGASESPPWALLALGGLALLVFAGGLGLTLFARQLTPPSAPRGTASPADPPPLESAELPAASRSARPTPRSPGVLETQRVLATAREGTLPGGLVAALVRYPEQPVVDLLAEHLRRITRELQDVVRETFLSVRLPDAAEAAAGEEALRGLPEAVERYLARQPGQPLGPTDQRLLSAAGKRFVLRNEADLPSGRDVIDFASVLGERIGRQVPPARLQLAGAICTALGQIGIAQGALEALHDYLRAEHDGRRAIPAGRALLQLGGARGLKLVETARSRFGPDSAFSRAMGEAMRLATATVAVREGSATDLIRRGQQRMERGQLEGALRDYDEALPLAEGDDVALAVINGRAEVLSRMGRLEEALRDAGRVIELAPDSWKGYANRGGMRGRTGDHAGSRADFDKALELGGSQHYGVYEGRALARRALGDATGAAGDIREALRVEGGLERCRDARLLTVFAQLVPPAEALPAARRAVELAPRRLAGWEVLATALRALKRHDEALRAIERARALAPESAELRAEHALSLVEAGRQTEARRLLAGLLQGEPQPLAYRARALLRFEQRDVEGALADLDRALELAPRDVDARWLRAQFRLEAGDLAGAEQDLTEVAAARPHLESVGRLLAKVRAARSGEGDPLLRASGGTPEQRAKALEEALRERPDDPRALTNLGALRLEQGALDAGLRLLDRALELDPDLVAAWSSRGQLKAKQGKLEAAKADLSEAVKRAPKLAKVWANRAGILLNLGELKQARADLDRALELDPELYGAWISRAAVRRKQRDVAGAYQDLTRATKLRPDLGLAFARRASLRLGAGDRKGALADYDQAIARRRLPLWLNARGTLRRELGDPSGALLDAVEATRLRPGEAVFWANRGNAEGQLGRDDKAEQSFTKALKLDPELSLAYYGRGYTRFRAGNFADALADLDQCLARYQLLEAHGLRGLALAKLRRAADAKGALRAFLARAPAKHPMRAECEQALGALGE